MKCPKCSSALHEMTIEGVDLDYCSGCKGLWLDKDELAFMVELATDIPEIEKVKQGAAKTRFPCPRCTSVLEEMRFTSADQLLLDRCPGCHGIWLDRAELPKAEKLASKMTSPKSKLMLVSRQLKEKGYSILGVQSGGKGIP